MKSYLIPAVSLLLAGGVALGLATQAVGQNDAVVDRVGFPVGYQNDYTVIRTVNKTQPMKFATIYANHAAASIKETGQLPYPAGSILVMEWAEPLKGADGALLTGANGLWRKGAVVRVDVMRHEPGYGEFYGEQRSGEWEFASYRPDGSPFQPPVQGVSCAKCHQQAGTARDFVFQGRFPPLEKN